MIQVVFEIENCKSTEVIRCISLRLVYFPLNLFEYVVTTLREHFKLKLVEKVKIKDEF